MNLTTRARRLQARTHWPYETCLQKIRDLGARPADLARENGWSIHQADALLLYPSVAGDLAPEGHANDPDPSAMATGALETDEEIVVKDIKVPAHGSANIPIISEKGPFRITSIAVPELVSRDCLIADLKIGRNSQLISSGAIHAFAFDEKLPPQGMYCDIMMRGMVTTLSVCNLNADEPLDFQATLKGKLIDDAKGNLWHASPPTRRTLLGLGAVHVTPGGKARITLQAQVVFKPDHLIMHPLFSKKLQLTSLRVVGREAAVSQDDLRSTGLAFFDAPIMQIGDWLCIEVSNLIDVSQLLCGAIGGTLI